MKCSDSLKKSKVLASWHSVAETSSSLYCLSVNVFQPWHCWDWGLHNSCLWGSVLWSLAAQACAHQGPVVVACLCLCDNQWWCCQCSPEGGAHCLRLGTMTVGIWAGIPGQQNFKCPKRYCATLSFYREGSWNSSLRWSNQLKVTGPGRPGAKLGLDPKTSESFCNALLTSQAPTCLPAPTALVTDLKSRLLTALPHGHWSLLRCPWWTRSSPSLMGASSQWRLPALSHSMGKALS